MYIITAARRMPPPSRIPRPHPDMANRASGTKAIKVRSKRSIWKGVDAIDASCSWGSIVLALGGMMELFTLFLSYHQLQYPPLLTVMAAFTFFSKKNKFPFPSPASLDVPASSEPQTGGQSATHATNYRKNFRWGGEYIPSDQKPTLSTCSATAAVPISHLKITPTQCSAIEEMYIRGALMILDDLRARGTNIPHIPIPQSLTDAHTLQAETVLTIMLRPKKADLPTSRAAEKLDDILREDDTVDERSDADADAEDDGDDDNKSVATDASSDSESDGEAEDSSAEASSVRAALGEQAVARTSLQIREMASTVSELQRIRVGVQYEEIIGLVANMERVRNIPPPPPASTQAPPDSATSPVVTSSASLPSTETFGPKRRRYDLHDRPLLPPSPEKAQKRHQSYGVH
ncbi:hypothetical protein DFH09DRAFT_1090362 [Mycena vulgaris]|nr:hypothetical protein DFH09DRAFT_1090362 [Mycena vulgaris]